MGDGPGNTAPQTLAMLQTCAVHGFAVIFVFASMATAAADESKASGWDSIDRAQEDIGRFSLHVREWPADGKVAMPAGFPQIIRAADGSKVSNDLVVEYSADATSVAILAPPQNPPFTVMVETAEETRQFDDGRIVLTALTATVEGSTAKLESHPGNHRIGFWSNPDDRTSWRWRPTRWGAYEVRLTYSTASPSGSEIEVRVGDTRLKGRLESTGSWYRYKTLPLGRVVIPTTGELAVEVRCTMLLGGAVMNLKAITLAPACEGETPRQADDGSILLHGHDATVRGTILRWEPSEKKQTLGFWTRPTDAAEWTFVIERPGTFAVEVLQGCGPGQGGSEMRIDFDPGEPTASSAAFTVEDTGGFQAFKPRVIGHVQLATAGDHVLRIQPTKIAKKAACDIRQIRLVPVGK